VTKTEQLKEQLKGVLTVARDIAADAEKADRDFTDDERATIQAKMAEAADLKAKIERADGDAAARKAIADLGDDIGLNDQTGDRQSPSGLIVPGGAKSLGELYTSSGEYREMLSSVPGGHFAKNHRVQSRPTGFKQLLPSKGWQPGAKALVTGASDTSGGAFVQNDYRGLQVGMDVFQRPLSLRDLVTGGTTTSDTIEYVRVTGTTNNAAPVAEATTSALPTAPGSAGALVNAAGGGYKPESGLATEKVTAIVKTIAHWIPITKRALSDAAQMRTLIDNFLQYGLEEELEDQMIAGNGAGENFPGLATVSGTQDQAYDTSFFATTRKAKTKLRTVGRSMLTGWVMHPNDVETMDLLLDGESRFYGNGPFGQAGPRVLWGAPVIESEAATPGIAWGGDWRKAILWDREQASITTTDSHADFFVRNLVAVLAEMRAAFGVLQPSAFIEVDLTP